MNYEQILDKIKGSFFGEALGDAMGWPVEFSQVWPSEPRIHNPLDDARKNSDGTAQFTDDTQMLIAATEGILQGMEEFDVLEDAFAGGFEAEIDFIDKGVARAFAEWYCNPVGGHRSPGGACGQGCTNLRTTLSRGDDDFFNAGKPGGRGCGAAMRSACYGWFWFNDPEAATKIAANHALMTHRSRNAQASAAAVAAAIIEAMKSPKDPRDVADAAYRAALEYDEKCARMIARAMYYAGNVRIPEDKVFDEFRGWVGDEAIAASIYAFLMFPFNYADAVRLAANTPGDSDSLGAITGALVGAFIGYSNLPDDWVEVTERAEHLTALSSRVADLVAEPEIVEVVDETPTHEERL